ncbi:ABC transporter permease [Acidisphaera sp. L21]|uniref:ABC transporter permease n=1 Tax=Acidisphaera sp. L21 TaxID=1641851 RepID=UPI001C201A4D|nr:ABC transporter permease [Acidisphaera sp. L21]
MDGGSTIVLPAKRRGLRTALRRYFADPYAVVGCVIYVVFIVLGILAGWLAQYDPTEILFTDDGQLAASLPPSAAHWLGTTNLGRDIFSQLVMGIRPSLFVGITAAVGVSALGTAVGVLAGYFGGVVDTLLMRLTDVVLGLPFLPFVIVLAALLGPSLQNVVFSVVILLWPNAARIIRAQLLTLMQRQFIEAARVTGASHSRIILVHILPNILPLSLLYGSISVGWAILTQASVSFLGFGDQDTISWGFMLQDAYASQALSQAQYNWFVPPGLCIVFVVAAGFFLSRGYENLIFPKLKQ